MTDSRQRFGRPLRLGLIGGAPGTWIANMHRTAAELGGWWRVMTGTFSSDPGRSRAAGPAMGVEPARSCGDVAEMFARERARDDGIDAVAIVTPSDTHYRFSAAALGESRRGFRSHASRTGAYDGVHRGMHCVIGVGALDGSGAPSLTAAPQARGSNEKVERPRKSRQPSLVEAKEA